MTIINSKNLQKVQRINPKLQNEVQGEYFSFVDDTGKKYFQLDTYGSKTRKQPTKVSQSIRMDKESAIGFINILKETFDIEEY